MPLKFKIKTKEEIPAEQQALYVERDGAWVLDVDGAVEKSKLDEFRATNVSLLKQLDEHKQRFEGIDPAEVRKLAEEKRKLEEAHQLKAGAVRGNVDGLAAIGVQGRGGRKGLGVPSQSRHFTLGETACGDLGGA